VNPARARLAAAVLVAALAVAAAAMTGLGGDRPAVVVADERGRQLASVRLPEGGRFALRYRHSVYRAEVTETFAATDGGFRLVAVASPSEAVLDYYELEGRRGRDGGWWRLEPQAAPAPGGPAPAGHRGRPAHPGGRGPPAAPVRPGRHAGPPGPHHPALTFAWSSPIRR
jgi:hypothetical protein